MIVARVKTSFSLERIDAIGDIRLLEYYFNLNIGLQKSPFRDENKPSFSIYLSNGRIKYKDFATGEFGGIYDMIGLKYGLDFNNTILKISKDFNINNIYIPQDKINNKKVCTHIAEDVDVVKESNVDIKIRATNWDAPRIEYMAMYGIDHNKACKFGVIPIDYYFINGTPIKTDKVAFAYPKQINGKVYYKIYQPLSKNKWRNNYPRDTMSLIEYLPESPRIVVVCSSIKDALCLYLNTGIPSISPQGEGFDINFNKLKEKYPKTLFFILFDNDDAGLKFSEKLSNKYQIPQIILPKFNGGKDVSDFYKEFGKDYLKTSINKIIRWFITYQVLL